MQRSRTNLGLLPAIMAASLIGSMAPAMSVAPIQMPLPRRKGKSGGSYCRPGNRPSRFDEQIREAQLVLIERREMILRAENPPSLRQYGHTTKKAFERGGMTGKQYQRHLKALRRARQGR